MKVLFNRKQININYKHPHLRIINNKESPLGLFLENLKKGVTDFSLLVAIVTWHKFIFDLR